MALDIKDINYIISTYKGLKYKKNEDIDIFYGTLSINHIYNDVHINEVFEITIQIDNDYPESIPSIIETSGKIRTSYPHCFVNKRLCLATELEQRICLEEKGISGWIEDFVIPYFFSYEYYKRYSVYPFGERSHGLRGILESYKELFKIEDNIDVYSVFEYAIKHQYRGHDKCPCGSGKKVRNCHGELIQNIIHSKFYGLIIDDFKIYENRKEKI